MITVGQFMTTSLEGLNPGAAMLIKDAYNLVCRDSQAKLAGKVPPLDTDPAKLLAIPLQFEVLEAVRQKLLRYNDNEDTQMTLLMASVIGGSHAMDIALGFIEQLEGVYQDEYAASMKAGLPESNEQAPSA